MKINKALVNIATNPMGANLDFLKYEIDSEVKGKTVYIQSGTHGGEVTQWILHEIFSYLKSNLKSGKVVIVPCSNPVAWGQRTYFSTNGKFDLYMGRDFNRNFPGSEDGSLGERMAVAIMKTAKGADFVIDLHTARKSIPFLIFTKADYEKYAKIMGMEYNQFMDIAILPNYKTIFNAALDDVGVANVCIECGSHDAYEENNIKNVVLAIKRLLKSLKMITDEHILDNNKKIKVFDKTVTYKANKGSIIRFLKDIGDEVKIGDTLYDYFDNNDLGNQTPHIANHDGVLFKISPTHIYYSGDEVLQILLHKSIKEI